MIQALNISKSFGALRALTQVSLKIGQGELTALLGANGAGKTTLLRILATLSKPSSGQITINGMAGDKKANEIRQIIGVVSHHTFLYQELTAAENLLFYGRMYGISDVHQHSLELLKRFDLYKRRNDTVRTFSRGMQQRLALARAILHQPQILLLDEPFTGLDLAGTELLTSFMRDFSGKGITILFTVHDINYALEHAPRVLILQKGKLVLDQAANTVRRAALLPFLEDR
jgi:heme exporter protein A